MNSIRALLSKLSYGEYPAFRVEATTASVNSLEGSQQLALFQDLQSWLARVSRQGSKISGSLILLKKRVLA